MKSSQLTKLLERTARPTVLVVGDVMLDRYLWGDVERISPEAPIPVLRVSKWENRLGGAGSVAAMLAALDVDVILGTVTADDSESHAVRRLLTDLQISGDCMLRAQQRITTVKERLLGGTQSRQPQQMIRVDREDCQPIGEELAEALLQSIRQRIGDVDAVLISDYNKGICTDSLVAQLVELARQTSVPVLADPARNVDYRRYAGCTCVTPNRSEAGSALGIKIETPQDGLEAAVRLLDFDVESAVVTLDRDGIAWADSRGNSRVFPVRSRQVYDITGAGDMVLAALGYGMAAGADWPMVIELANLAGGLEVQRLGVAPLSRDELLAELTHGAFSNEHKVVSPDRIEQQLLQRRRAGERVAMTNGCFDLLHPGHVASLQFARNQADCLVVGLNSDRSVEHLKGAGHPIVPEQGRAEMLAALGCVDYVVIFDDPSVTGLVGQVLPDVLVKAAEYGPEEVVGHEIVKRHGGRVVLAPVKGDYATSRLIRRIQSISDSPTPGEK